MAHGRELATHRTTAARIGPLRSVLDTGLGESRHLIAESDVRWSNIDSERTMSNDGPGPQPGWKPGDGANGPGPDNDWRQLPSEPPEPRRRDIANNPIPGPDDAWGPLLPEPPKGKPWYKRPLGVTGIVVGGLFIFGLGSAMAGDRDPSDGNPKDDSGAVLTPPSGASDEPSTPAEGAATTRKKEPKPKTYLVTNVVDGDTIDSGQRPNGAPGRHRHARAR